MSPVPRAVVEAFYHALSVRDMAALANFLDDDVVWTISGQVDILPFCGQRVGKGLVMKLLGPRLGLDGGGQRDSHTLLSERRFVAKTMLVDGDRAAVLSRLTATKRASGQAISYRIAHFIQFRDEKVVDYVSIIDRFDADEQLLGYNLDALGSGSSQLVAYEQLAHGLDQRVFFYRELRFGLFLQIVFAVLGVR